MRLLEKMWRNLDITETCFLAACSSWFMQFASLSLQDAEYIYYWTMSVGQIRTLLTPKFR
uniref:Uncharacterized protein n=1 Tax=Oryza brachyantha TaxID=4533 RepID=J3MLA5_ORYBR